MKNHQPDLSHLQAASESIRQILKKGDTVVYKSTVYPSVTEQVCIPVLQSASGLSVTNDFSVGHSPERISPGDDKHPLSNTLKVVSGDTCKVPRALQKFIGVLWQQAFTLPPVSKLQKPLSLLKIRKEI